MDITLSTPTSDRTAETVHARSSWLAGVGRRWPDGHLAPLAGVLAAHATPITSSTDWATSAAGGLNPRARTDPDDSYPLALVVDLSPELVLEILRKANLVPAGLQGQLSQLTTSGFVRGDHPPAGRHWGTVLLTHPEPDPIPRARAALAYSPSSVDLPAQDPR